MGRRKGAMSVSGCPRRPLHCGPSGMAGVLTRTRAGWAPLGWAGRAQRWFFRGADGIDQGPVNFRVLRAYIRLGQVTLEARVWREGEQEWHLARDVSIFNSCTPGLPRSGEVADLMEETGKRIYEAQTVFATGGGTPLFPRTPASPGAVHLPATSGRGTSAEVARGEGGEGPDGAEWFYIDAEKEYRGPLDNAKMKELLRTGVVSDDTWVWSELAQSEWAQMKNASTLGKMRVSLKSPTFVTPRTEPRRTGAQMSASPFGQSPGSRQPMTVSSVVRPGAASKTGAGSQAELKRLRAELRQAREELQGKDSKIKSYKSKLKEARTELQEQDSKIENLQRDLEAAEIRNGGGGQDLEEELAGKTQKIEELKSLLSEKDGEVLRAREALTSQLTWLIDTGSEK